MMAYEFAQQARVDRLMACTTVGVHKSLALLLARQQLGWLMLSLWAVMPISPKHGLSAQSFPPGLQASQAKVDIP